jgi:hypothetical protein
MPRAWKMPAADRHRDHDVDELEAEDPQARLGARADDAPLGQRRVQVDHVRHHGRAEDARGEQQRLRALKARDEAARDAAPRRVGEPDLEREADHDHAHEHANRSLEVTEAA